MPDLADQAQKHEADHLRRALERRRPRLARICTICGEAIPAEQIARDRDATACAPWHDMVKE